MTKTPKSKEIARLSCPCGFKGTTRNIRAHRVNCEVWLAELRQQIAPVDNGADTARAIAGAILDTVAHSVE